MKAIFMDKDERKVKGERPFADPRDRKPRLEYGGGFYEAARQNDDGDWIYRHIPETK